MADRRFFHCEGPLTAGAIAELVGGQCSGDSQATYEDIASLEVATASMVSFFTNPRLADQLAASQAGAILINEKNAALCPPSINAIVCADPYRAMAQVAQALYSMAATARPVAGELQNGDAVHADAIIGENVHISLGAVIGPQAEIGDGTIIGAGAVIGHGVVIGRDCVIGPNTNLSYCLMGNRVIVHAGAVIGSDGFGFAPGEKHLKIPQLGRVIVQDDVEIGANTTLDRGALNDTLVGEGTKLDNLVHLAHNVEVGRHCFFAAGVGISGGTKIGDYVQMGGHAGAVGHVEIGSHSLIGGKAMVTKSLPPHSDVSGMPARNRNELYRDQIFITKLRQSQRKKPQD